MAITKLQPFNLDTTANYTFANITATNANLGNAASANFFIGSGANLTSLPAGNISGQVANALVASTVYTNAQPNITSVGTLTGITSTGTADLTGASNVALGPVANVHITGGSNGQYLQTDGSGILSWSTVSSGSTSTISNGNSNVNIPTNNGNVNISSAGNANIVIVTGTGVNIAGTLNTTGNTTVGNLFSSGSGGNISNVNVISANTFIASGNITAGNIVTSGSGGNISNANVISANIVNATLSANLGNSVTANFFIGSGANLTSLPAGNISGQVANALVASTVYTNAQPNITSVGTLTGLTSNGIVNFANTSNTTLGAVGNVRITGGSNGQYLQTDGSGTLSWSTVSSGSTSNISNGNSNVNIPSANGNINLTAVGNTTMVVTGTGVNIAGTLNATGNITAGNVVTSGSGGNISNANVISANTFIASGNVTAGNIVTSGSGGNISNANVISANTFTASGNITAGNANLGNAVTANYFIGNFYGTANSATSATTAGTVTTAAQPNITSVGSLTGLTVSNATGVVNFTTTANVTLGAVANLHISGGTNAYVLSTDGSGNLSWVAQSGGGGGSSISNGNSNVTVTANGNVTTSVAGNANILIVTGTGVNIAGTLNATGNITAGNVVTSGSGGNISNANVISANTFIASGDITATNINTTGSGGNIGNANVISANTFTASGNITAGNANLGNNVTANFFIGSGANLTSLPAGNISGQVANSLVSGTVYTNAQPNITSVGTLTGLTSTGTADLTGASNVSLGAVGNVKITGGTNAYVLSTDGSGNLSWVVQSGGGGGSSISNGNSNVNIPTSNGNINFTAVGNTNMVITGTSINVASILNTTGNVTFTGANVSLGAVGNVKITGGTNAYVLSTDGSGNLSWVAQSGGGGGGSSISNGTSNVNIAASDGNITMGVGGTSNVVVVTTAGIISAIQSRVVTIADATSITMNADTTDLAIQTNTQTAGTLTINAVSGTLLNGQKITLRLQSANIQTFSWNAVFTGSVDLPLPTVSSGSNKYDYMGFIYNTTASKWQLLAKNFGF